MIYSKVTLKLHWGFAVSHPIKARAKPSYLLPPPTTLIGALSYGAFRGLDSDFLGEYVGSPAYKLQSKIKGAFASFSKDFSGTYIEDIVRNVTYYYERYKDRSHWYNVVPTGKVYSPGQEIKVVYLADSLSSGELARLSWSIVRLGCKECLVSVKDVEIGEAKEVKGKIATPYYFPADVKLLSSPLSVIIVDFWDYNGYLWGKRAGWVKYAIPNPGFPLLRNEVEVDAKLAYQVGDEYVVLS
ncbi:type I-A CRISPR-associated protein Cas5a [Acidilobus sp.]|uniref:type I-A CRISPR-associated protein Cas5a n=1 Tax=Acidilobus sp. TaxID=1872109 RepID=UPI003D043DD8